MKKLIKYLFVFAGAGLVATSCSDILETKTQSSFGAEDVFSQYSLAEQSNFGIIQALTVQNAYRGRFLPWYGFNTDIEWYNSIEGSSGKADVGNYSIDAANGQLNTSTNGPYADMFTAIERANLCIVNLRKYGNTENDKDMAYLLGEALTLRAMIYSDIVKAWGDVPARFEPVTAETLYLPKSNRDVIYKQLLADLEESFNYLPWPNTTTATQSAERVNLAYAKGLYARICLAASGYALRPDDDKIGTGDAGTIRRSNDAELAPAVLYPKALQACKDVIAESGCDLYGDYEQLWRDNNNFVTAAGTIGKEALWIFPFGDGRGRWNYTFAVKHKVGDQYQGASSGRGGDVGPVPTLFFDYDKEDTRRDVSCVNYLWDKVSPSDKKSVQMLAGIDTWYFGKYRFEWMETQPYTGGNDDGMKPIYMRFSDVLLMAAECANDEACGSDLATAKTYLRRVRERAYSKNKSMVDEYLSTITNNKQMFDALVKERALEFVGEFVRKGDLIRWNLLKEKMDEAKTKMTNLAARSGNYSYLSGKVYYKYDSDKETLKVYGLERGETATPDATWTVSSSSTDYIWADDANKKGLYTAKINSMYAIDPDTRQFWPIFSGVISASQGSVKNDYGY